MTKKTSAAEVLHNNSEAPLGPLVIPVRALEEIEVLIGGSEDGTILQNKLTEREKDIITGKVSGGQRDPIENSRRMREGGWKERAHYTVDGKVGHPVEGFIRCLGAAIGKNYKTSKGVKFTYPIDITRNLSIDGDAPGSDGQGMLVVFTKHKFGMHTHWAQLQGKSPIPLYRPGISEWEALLHISFNPTVFTANDVLSLLGAAGSAIGVGAYRKEKRGTFGTFTILRAERVK